MAAVMEWIQRIEKVVTLKRRSSNNNVLRGAGSLFPPRWTSAGVSCLARSSSARSDSSTFVTNQFSVTRHSNQPRDR